MAHVRVLVLRAAGINCDEETAFAWEAAGAEAQRVHINRLCERPTMLSEFQVLSIPGGFSYGDDIGAGAILGHQLSRQLGDPVRAFVERGSLVLGICNGFQVLVRAGLLPGLDCGVPVSLTRNDRMRYESRWVRLRTESVDSPFLEPGESLEMAIGHGEGRFAVADESALTVLETRKRIAFRYVAPDGGTPKYPDNPNGSAGNVAGLIDSTGRILGMMPHPERSMLSTHHPLWTRRDNADSDGLRLFRRATASLR